MGIIGCSRLESRGDLVTPLDSNLKSNYTISNLGLRKRCTVTKMKFVMKTDFAETKPWDESGGVRGFAQKTYLIL